MVLFQVSAFNRVYTPLEPISAHVQFCLTLSIYFSGQHLTFWDVALCRHRSWLTLLSASKCLGRGRDGGGTWRNKVQWHYCSAEETHQTSGTTLKTAGGYWYVGTAQISSSFEWISVSATKLDVAWSACCNDQVRKVDGLWMSLPTQTSTLLLGIGIVQAALWQVWNQRILGIYSLSWMGWKRGAEAEALRSTEKSQKSHVCWCADNHPAYRGDKVWLGLYRFRRKGFQGREQNQWTTAFHSFPPLTPFPVEVKARMNTHRTDAVPTLQDENNFFSSYMIFACSYVTRYLMTVKYCIILILKMHTSLEDRSHFSKWFLNATFTNTFIFLLLLTCSLTF